MLRELQEVSLQKTTKTCTVSSRLGRTDKQLGGGSQFHRVLSCRLVMNDCQKRGQRTKHKANTYALDLLCGTCLSEASYSVTKARSPGI
jgi:hypothetical protein